MRWREGGVGERRGSEAGGRKLVGEGATGAINVGADDGYEVDGWGPVVAAPPWAVAAGAGRGAAALA